MSENSFGRFIYPRSVGLFEDDGGRKPPKDDPARREIDRATESPEPPEIDRQRPDRQSISAIVRIIKGHPPVGE